MLWLTVPMAVMWSGVSGSGGVLMVIAHSLLVVLYFTTFDGWVMGCGLEARLTLSRGRSAQSVGISRVLSASAGVGVALVSVLLLFESGWIAAVCAGSGVLIVALVTRAGRASLGWRMRWSEFLWAAVVVVGPMMLIRAIALGLDERALAGDGAAVVVRVMSPGVVWMSVLGAVSLGVFVLLCAVRDAAIDLGDGIKTSATGLGGYWSRVAVGVWLVFGLSVAVFIAANQVLGRNSWGIAALYGATALLTQGMVWAQSRERAVVVWWAGAGLVGALGAGAVG